MKARILSIMLVIQNRNPSMLPHLHGNVRQYLMNKLSNMLTGIIQGSKLFSTNRRYGHQNSPSQADSQICVFTTDTLNSNRFLAIPIDKRARFDEKLPTTLVKYI
jgi:hypothetical protein